MKDILDMFGKKSKKKKSKDIIDMGALFGSKKSKNNMIGANIMYSKPKKTKRKKYVKKSKNLMGMFGGNGGMININGITGGRKKSSMDNLMLGSMSKGKSKRNNNFVNVNSFLSSKRSNKMSVKLPSLGNMKKTMGGFGKMTKAQKKGILDTGLNTNLFFSKDKTMIPLAMDCAPLNKLKHNAEMESEEDEEKKEKEKGKVKVIDWDEVGDMTFEEMRGDKEKSISEMDKEYKEKRKAKTEKEIDESISEMEQDKAERQEAQKAIKDKEAELEKAKDEAKKDKRKKDLKEWKKNKGEVELKKAQEQGYFSTMFGYRDGEKLGAEDAEEQRLLKSKSKARESGVTEDFLKATDASKYLTDKQRKKIIEQQKRKTLQEQQKQRMLSKYSQLKARRDAAASYFAVQSKKAEAIKKRKEFQEKREQRATQPSSSLTNYMKSNFRKNVAQENENFSDNGDLGDFMFTGKKKE